MLAKENYANKTMFALKLAFTLARGKQCRQKKLAVKFV